MQNAFKNNNPGQLQKFLLWLSVSLFFVGLCYHLLCPPRAGLPDNGDATRVFNRHDLLKNDTVNMAHGYSPYLVTHYRYLVPYFDKSVFFYIPSVNDLFIMPARVLAALFMPAHTFDVGFLAVVLIIVYTAAFYLLSNNLLHALNFKTGMVLVFISGLLLADVLFIGYFNSFLQDFALFPILLFFVSTYNRRTFLQAVPLLFYLLFCALKEQYMPFLLFIPWLFPQLLKPQNRRGTFVLSLFVCLFFVFTVKNMVNYSPTHNLNRLYEGILKTDLKGQSEAMEWFGINPTDAAKVAQIKFSSKKIVSAVKIPNTEKIFIFWLAHPIALFQSVWEANKLFSLSDPYCGGKIIALTMANSKAGQTKKYWQPLHYILPFVPIWWALMLLTILVQFRKLGLSPHLRLLLFLVVAILIAPLIAFVGDGFNDLERHCMAVYFYTVLTVPVWALVVFGPKKDHNSALQ